jgi:hypothetical protein
MCRRRRRQPRDCAQTFGAVLAMLSLSSRTDDLSGDLSLCALRLLTPIYPTADFGSTSGLWVGKVARDSGALDAGSSVGTVVRICCSVKGRACAPSRWRQSDTHGSFPERSPACGSTVGGSCHRLVAVRGITPASRSYGRGPCSPASGAGGLTHTIAPAERSAVTRTLSTSPVRIARITALGSEWMTSNSNDDSSGPAFTRSKNRTWAARRGTGLPP